MKKIRAGPLLRGDRILIPIILLAAFIRVWGLGAAPFFDETYWALLMKDMLGGSFHYTSFISHPPLSVLLYYVFALLGGLSIPVLRLMPFFTGLLTIIVSYYFAKSLYGRKIAVISAFLMSIIFYPVWMSLFIDVDGNVLTLFSLLTLFSFHKFEKGRDRKWILFAGIFLGLAALSKYPAVLLVPVLLVYDLFANRLRNAKYIALLAIAGIAIFSAFPAISFVSSSFDVFTDTIKWGGANIGRADSQSVLNAYVLSVSRLFIFLFQYGTPVLCLIPLYMIFLKRYEKKDYLLFSYAGIILVFFTFVIPGGPKARYIMPAVPALAILASRSIPMALGKTGARDAKKFVFILAVSFALLVFLNAYGVQGAFNSQNIDTGLLLRNSMFWYSGFASTPFAIHVHSLMFVAIASIILFMLSFKFGKNFAIAVISISMAFNFFILAQSFYPTAGPNFTSTVFEMTEYYKAGNLNCTALYSTEKALMFYLDNVKPPDDIIGGKNLKGCVFALNVQDYSESEDFMNAVSSCRKLNTFYSNGFQFGSFYICG